MTQVAFEKVAKVKGSKESRINVSFRGRPYGQIWTFDAKGESHPFHLKTLSGLYQVFEHDGTKAGKKAAGFDAMAYAKHLCGES